MRGKDVIDPDGIDRTIFATAPTVALQIASTKQFFVPLLPLAEKHRIVAKVDALIALCDALEARLKEQAEVQGRLAGAVVKQVAG